MKRKLSEKELMKRKFRKFLSDNDCITEWYRNARKQRKVNDVLKGDPTHWMWESFTWKYTKEGHNYWSNIANLWEEEFNTSKDT